MSNAIITEDAIADAALIAVAAIRPVLGSELSPEGYDAALRLTRQEARLVRYTNDWRGGSAFVTPELYEQLREEWYAQRA